MKITGGSGSNSESIKLHTHAPQCYELRLHDGDGEPDEDFPALDKSRQIENFGNDGEFEYVLCQIQGVDVPPVNSISLNVNESRARYEEMIKGLGENLLPVTILVLLGAIG